MSVTAYFKGTPKRFHDVERYRVARTVRLSFTNDGDQKLKVFEIASKGLVWSKGSWASTPAPEARPPPGPGSTRRRR